MKRITAIILMILILLVGNTMPINADTSQDITVKATPGYISVSNAPNVWVLNGITGDSKILINSIYYANPLGDTVAPSAVVVDGECRFTLTNSSTVNITLTVNIGNFSGGDADMINSNTGDNDSNKYGAYSWYSGLTYTNKVIAKTSGSSALISNYDGMALKWGAEIKTQTQAWSGGAASIATMNLIIVAS